MRIIIVIFLLVSVQLWGQPKGGGGLRVLNVYDEHKQPIDVKQLKIKLLKLDSSVGNIVAEYDIPSERNFYVGSDGKKMIKLPPSNHFSNTQGLVITYKNKTYRVDFEKILIENGAGYVEKIDSLVLFKPYILNKRSYDYQSLSRKEFNKYYLLLKIAKKYLRWGVTPETYKHLSAIDLMYDTPKNAHNKPKPWMESFKQLYADYSERNKHSKEEYADYLKRIDEMISKYGDLEPFVILKMHFLHEGAHYKEFIFYYEKKPAGYRRVSKEAIQAYCYLKEYDKAITLAKERASEEKGKYKKYSMEYDYMLYSFDWFFIKSYYKDESIKNELESFVSGIDLDKDDEFYSTILKRFEELKRYDSYREKKKLTDKEKEQKESVKANLLEVFKEGCIWCYSYFKD